MVWRY